MKRSDPENDPPDDGDDDGDDDSPDWRRSPTRVFDTEILLVPRRRRHHQPLLDSGKAGHPSWTAETAF